MTIKERFKQYQQLVDSGVKYCEVKGFPNYEIFQNKQVWSWNAMNWVKPRGLYYYFNQLPKRKNFSINTLMKEHFGIEKEKIEYAPPEIGCRHKPIEGHEDYQIYENNQVWSKKTGMWRKLQVVEDHWAFVISLGNNKFQSISVHRELYKAFKGAIPEGYVIHHQNFCSLDNSLNNLVLLTKKEHNLVHNKPEKMLEKQKR